MSYSHCVNLRRPLSEQMTFMHHGILKKSVLSAYVAIIEVSSRVKVTIWDNSFFFVSFPGSCNNRFKSGQMLHMATIWTFFVYLASKTIISPICYNRRVSKMLPYHYASASGVNRQMATVPYCLGQGSYVYILVCLRSWHQLIVKSDPYSENYLQ